MDGWSHATLFIKKTKMKLVILKNGKEFKISDDQASLMHESFREDGAFESIVALKSDESLRVIVSLGDISAIISKENMV